jgi:hypothetical protein
MCEIPSVESLFKLNLHGTLVTERSLLRIPNIFPNLICIDLRYLKIDLFQIDV